MPLPLLLLLVKLGGVGDDDDDVGVVAVEVEELEVEGGGSLGEWKTVVSRLSESMQQMVVLCGLGDLFVWMTKKQKRGLPGIEPGTSCTLSKNHTPRPQSLLIDNVLRCSYESYNTFTRAEHTARKMRTCRGYYIHI